MKKCHQGAGGRERQEIEGATPVVLPNPRDHPIQSLPIHWLFTATHTDRWEKPGKEDVILFRGKYSSSLASGLLHKLIPALCLSRSHPRTCTSSNEHVFNSRIFHEDGSTGKSSPWAECKEQLKTLHLGYGSVPLRWLVNSHTGDFTRCLPALLKPAVFPCTPGGSSLPGVHKPVLGYIVSHLSTSSSSWNKSPSQFPFLYLRVIPLTNHTELW